MRIYLPYKIYLFCVIFLLSIFSCKNAPENKYKDLDLMVYGLPIKIKAPEGAEVKVDDMGIVQDVTVKAGDDFYLQILSGVAYSFDLPAIIQKQKADVVNSKYFSKIIQEDDHGFIFEKKYSEERITYDFRCVKIQGDREYVFQTGLMGKFSLEDAQSMYASVL
jgi:hypothetical protein